MTSCRTVVAILASATLLRAINPVVNQYCIGCHSGKSPAANVALNTDPATHPDDWEKAVRKLRARMMPPVGLPRPDDATYNALLSSLETDLDRLPINPGRTDTFRRLNRTEYHNVIRDLLALDVDVANLLPSDESSHGFDNVTVGDLPPTLLERYLTAAQKIARLALGRPLRSPGGDTVNLPPDLTQEQHFENLPFGTHGGMALHYTFPVDADYQFQIRLQRDRNEHVEGLHGEHQLELLVDGRRVQVFTVKPPPGTQDHHLVDKDLNVRIPVSAGPHELAVDFLKPATSLLETGRQPYQAHFNMDRHPRITPALFSLSINGPYDAKGHGDTPSRRRVLICTPSKPADAGPCARRIVAQLTRRAYRRPVTDADLVAPLKFFHQANGDTDFDGGIEMALRAILVSPEFLFRVEQDPAGIAPNTNYRIPDLALASRLSFFLWSSIPDDSLLDAAAGNTLHTPAVLDAQVRRMLADRRARSLTDNFADQWLYLRNLASTTPDMRTFTDFDDNLRQAFRQETQLFFDSILREDRSILTFLNADYTFVNERLARHYGIPNIYGSRFRRIEFPAGSTRGGLLRQGSILTVTSYATRTSPVIRGKWILANVLGVPPPPPPAAVPALKEDHRIDNALPMRARLAEHRANPACAGCHNLMDPVGFAMENYDAVGRWRLTDEGKPLDVTGALPDGSKFEGVDGLQKALLHRPELFANTFTEKLLTYALGRGVEYYDAPAVRRIVHDAQAKDYKFSAFILGITNSPPFQMRRSQ